MIFFFFFFFSSRRRHTRCGRDWSSDVCSSDLIMRVRGFTQDDGHVFCTEDQIQPEVLAFTTLLQKVYADFGTEDRSEEHTSELQSRPHLVCRLLLEKKKLDEEAGP